MMDIMTDALHHQLYLTSTFLDGGLTLNHFAQWFLMQLLYPKVRTIASPDGRHFPLVMCGIILYTDNLAVDHHSHLSLEPVYFTLSLFNQKTRNKPEAWHRLGYIPNIGLV
jgi:hypothetical protein